MQGRDRHRSEGTRPIKSEEDEASLSKIPRSFFQLFAVIFYRKEILFHIFNSFLFSIDLFSENNVTNALKTMYTSMEYNKFNPSQIRGIKKRCKVITTFPDFVCAK